MPLRRLKKNPPPSLHERRRYARAQNSLAIKLEDKDVDFVTETKNISCIGAYCQIDGYLPILTKLKITLLLPKTRGLKAPQHITCEGTVVRIEKCADAVETNKFNIAIYFNAISPRDMKLIDRHVKTHLAQNTASPAA